jgi:hypothetical protein
MAITIIYHEEAEGWWAESVDAPGFFAAGATRDEVRHQVYMHLPHVLGLDAPLDPENVHEAYFFCGPVLESTEPRREWVSRREWIGAIPIPAGA